MYSHVYRNQTFATELDSGVDMNDLYFNMDETNNTVIASTIDQRLNEKQVTTEESLSVVLARLLCYST